MFNHYKLSHKFLYDLNQKLVNNFENFLVFDNLITRNVIGDGLNIQSHNSKV